jgi:hypothetical protein
MNVDAFESAEHLLTRAGFAVTEAHYHAQDFGSWDVVAEATLRVRIVWDGRDGWLIVQRQSDESPNSPPEWTDVWIERDRARQTLANAILKLRELCGSAAPTSAGR